MIGGLRTRDGRTSQTFAGAQFAAISSKAEAVKSRSRRTQKRRKERAKT